MITAYAWLALAAALAAADAALPYAAHGLHGLHALHGLHLIGLYALTGLAVLVWAHDRRRRAVAYHRRGRAGLTHHRRPTRRHRVLVALARVRHLHLTTDTAARTA